MFLPILLYNKFAIFVVDSGMPSMGLHKAARAYNVPIETLRNCVASIVSRSGPPTVLMSEEEAEYCIAMADMGFGWGMAMVFVVTEKTGRNHSFKSGHAGRGGMKVSCLANLYFLCTSVFLDMLMQFIQTKRPLMISLPSLVQFSGN